MFFVQIEISSVSFSYLQNTSRIRLEKNFYLTIQKAQTKACSNSLTRAEASKQAI